MGLFIKVSLIWLKPKQITLIMKILYALLMLLLSLTTRAQEKTYHYMDTDDGLKIAYTDEGKGEAVMLIHGFISSGCSWDKSSLKKELLNSGFRVIVPDLRGNGKSSQPHDPKMYAGNIEISDLIALATHLKLDEYDAVGYSRGSIVLANQLTKDKRIKKAVLGGVGLDFSNPQWERRVMFADAFSGRKVPNDITSGAVNYAKSIGADLEILGYLQDYQPVTTPEELKTITAKVLVIAGDKDKGNGEPAELQAAIPGSKLVLVPGEHNGTHHSPAFAEAIIDFLNQ